MTKNQMRCSIAALLALVLTSACSKSPTVPGGGNPPPVSGLQASFTAAGTRTQTFTDKSSGATITAWDWNFGDGSAHVQGQNPVHMYDTMQLKTYNVTLTVTDDQGKTTSKTQSINVLPFRFDRPGISSTPAPLPSAQPGGYCLLPALAPATIMAEVTATPGSLTQVYLKAKGDGNDLLSCGSSLEVCPGAIDPVTFGTQVSQTWNVPAGDWCVLFRNRSGVTSAVNGNLTEIY